MSRSSVGFAPNENLAPSKLGGHIEPLALLEVTMPSVGIPKRVSVELSVLVLLVASEPVETPDSQSRTSA